MIAEGETPTEEDYKPKDDSFIPEAEQTQTNKLTDTDAANDHADGTKDTKTRELSTKEKKELVDQALSRYLGAVESGDRALVQRIQNQVASNSELASVFEARLNEIKRFERQQFERSRTEIEQEYLNPVTRTFQHIEQNSRYYHALNARQVGELNGYLKPLVTEFQRADSLAALLTATRKIAGFNESRLDPTLRRQFRAVQDLGRVPDDVIHEGRIFSAAMEKLKEAEARMRAAYNRIRTLSI